MYEALKTIENRGSENKGAYQPASKIKKWISVQECVFEIYANFAKAN